MNLFFAQVIDSLETKEIVSLVLKKLPDPVTVDLSAFEVMENCLFCCMYELTVKNCQLIWEHKTSGHLEANGYYSM